MKTFWTNTIWYILLGLTIIFEIIYVFKKEKRHNFIAAFYFTVTGITLTIEVILLIIFQAYHYYPGIVPISYYDDELSGNLFSQFSIAATALLISALNLKFYWSLIFSGIYGVIEELFLALGVYSHVWYRTWMTLAGLPVLFWIIKKLYKKSLKECQPLLHYFNIYLSLTALDTVTILWGFILSGNFTYYKNFGYNPPASPYLVSYLHTTIISVILMVIYFKKLKPLLKGLVILFLYVLTWILSLFGIVYFKNLWWFFSFTTLYVFGVYFSIVLMDNLYKKGRIGAQTAHKP